MPVQHAIWTVGLPPTPLPAATLPSEQTLEEIIIAAPHVLSGEWMLIGRQEQTTAGGRIDLLAIAPDASLVLIELKRNRTPREVVAQALDYAAWVEKLSPQRVAAIYHRFSGGGDLGSEFKEKFGAELDEDALNESHQIVLVAAELDDSTERIINYLNSRGVAINVMFFQVFQHDCKQLLSRAWLIEPGQAQAGVSTTKGKGEKEPWNGEFYVSFGPLTYRSWEAAREYGFISAGGGTWYSQTLKLLSPGDRIWVNIPKTGYVGVGIVQEEVQPVTEFTVTTPEGEQPYLEAVPDASKYLKNAHDPEKAEYFVKVAWLDDVPVAQAVNEVGLFGNQNTVCQPTTPKWRHTVDRLKARFTKWNENV